MIVGIDLGTTNSLIGVMESGIPVLFADGAGRRLTPSAVWFPSSEEPVAGERALEHPGEAVVSIKRLMGRRVGEEGVEGAVVGKPGEPVRLRAGGRSVSPEEVSAVILRKLKGDAELALGEPVTRAVITVPAYFNDGQRAATKRAGELAGLTVERLLAEPTAAALAYGLDRLDERSRIAVFDLGGGTFDISVLELRGGVFHVLATNGDTRLGGDDLDRAVAGKFGISVGEAERARKETTAGGPSRFSRAEIEDVCLPIVERTRRHCLRSLHDAKLEATDLDRVILVGGATRMPLVRRFVKSVFGRAPDTSQHPDEAVALGAVIQAGILEGSVQEMTLLDVTPLSLGIETLGGMMNVLIARNSTIPCKAGEMFTNAAANQSSMRITVLQGEREMARDNWKLGEFEIPFTPAPRGQARVGVQFEIDANGLLQVLARDIATGLDTRVEMASAVDVSDGAVEQMLADSLEHAYEDMDARAFAEASVKAEEMLPAIESALDQLGGEVPAAERSAIAELVEKARAARTSGSLSAMKSALDDLDRITEPLAARLIESLMAPAAPEPLRRGDDSGRDSS